jgi:hypothetical protein
MNEPVPGWHQPSTPPVGWVRHRPAPVSWGRTLWIAWCVFWAILWATLGWLVLPFLNLAVAVLALFAIAIGGPRRVEVVERRQLPPGRP